MRSLELKVPPVAIALIGAILMWGAKKLIPSQTIAVPDRFLIALGLVGVGLAFVAAGVFAFRKARTTVNPTRPQATSVMVASGVYRLSRNPMYLGFLLVLLGWAVFLSNVLALSALPLFVVYMNLFQIVPEERALLAQFGSDYRAYLLKVRRWL